jgi:hypothetical protein
VAAVSGIGDDVIERVADDPLHGRNDGGERMAIIRVTGQRAATWATNWPPPRIPQRRLVRLAQELGVQPKAVMFPTDGGAAPILPAGRQVRADQAPAVCSCQAVQARQSQPRKLKTYLGRVIRDIWRKTAGNEGLIPKLRNLDSCYPTLCGMIAS